MFVPGLRRESGKGLKNERTPLLANNSPLLVREPARENEYV